MTRPWPPPTRSMAWNLIQRLWVGREYPDMNEPNLDVIVNDGRYVLRTTETQYNLIAVDTYHQSYIPS